MSDGGKRGAGLIRIVLLLVGGLLACEIGLRAYAAAKGIGRDDLGSLLGRERAAEAADRGPELRRSDIVQPSRHEELIYELKPAVRGTLADRLVHTNELGLRGREIELEKPPNTYRIAGLGDSHMFGTGVAEGQTYLDLLERRLNAAAAPGRRYEVLNFATPGFNTAQEVAMLEVRALAFDPDLVIVHVIHDDLAVPRYLRDPAGSTSGFSSYLVTLLSTLAEPVDEGEPTPPSLVRSSEASERLLEQLAERDYMTGLDGARRSLERLARATAERGIPVVVMMLGDGGATREALRQAAEELEFHFFNVLTHFSDHLTKDGAEPTREEWRQAYFMRGDLPTELAHRVYADALFEKVLELDRSPGAEPESAP